MLIENTLFGQVDKVQVAVDRIRQFCPPDDYWLAFSGGKDSVTIHRLAQMAGVRFDAHYAKTGIDPPELVQFIRGHYPDVILDRPPKSIFQVMMHDHLFPPLRTKRWCCDHLKEGGGRGRFVITGIRWEESYWRRRRSLTDSCVRLNKRFIHPIIDWTADDVWAFIHQEGLPYCRLYDEGFTRLGCILCPYGHRNADRDIARWPKFAKAWKVALGRLIIERNRRGLKTSFTTGEEFFAWWIGRNAGRQSDRQPPLFT